MLNYPNAHGEMIHSLIIHSRSIDSFELLEEDADLVAVGGWAGVEEEWLGGHGAG